LGKLSFPKAYLAHFRIGGPTGSIGLAQPAQEQTSRIVVAKFQETIISNYEHLENPSQYYIEVV
jgi:hypothetical protein